MTEMGSQEGSLEVLMKKTVTIAVGVAALVFLFAAGASAGAVIKVQAHVPFAFYAGKTLMPAGQYRFELRPMSPYGASTSAVLVRGEKGFMAWIATLPGFDGDMAVHLHFNQYGKAYFLSKVESSGLQANVPPTRAEREYRAQTKVGNTVLIAAK